MKTEVKITPAQEMVLYDSPEAAQFVTGISGWVNRHGMFYGNGKDAEDMARWSGCTHKKCECGNIMEKRWTMCDVCRERNSIERYKDRERKKIMKFKEFMNEKYPYPMSIGDLQGKKVKSVKYPRGSVDFIFDDGTFARMSCHGGNDVVVDYGDDYTSLKNLQKLAIGRTIKDVKYIDNYEIWILFDNNKKISIIDDTGGEGIEIEVRKK
jgi:hypothetical protein